MKKNTNIKFYENCFNNKFYKYKRSAFLKQRSPFYPKAWVSLGRISWAFSLIANASEIGPSKSGFYDVRFGPGLCFGPYDFIVYFFFFSF